MEELIKTYLHRDYREANAWLREREDGYYRRGIYVIIYLLGFADIFVIISVFQRTESWVKGLIYIFLSFCLLIIGILLLALISERRLGHHFRRNPYHRELIRKSLLPGYYILLREESSLMVIKAYIGELGLRSDEIEIMERLVLDGSDLSFNELDRLSRNFCKLS